MAIRPPKILQAWRQFSGALAPPEQPYLFGEGKEAGIMYPEGYTSPTPEESMSRLEASVRGGAFRSPTILRGEGGPETDEAFNIPPEKPREPTRQDIINSYIKRFGDPYDIDPRIETAKIMEEEDRKIRKRIGMPEYGDLKHLSPQMRKTYNEVYTQKEGETLVQQEREKLHRIEHFKHIMTMYDKDQEAKAETAGAVAASRAEVRAERGPAIKEAAEMRALTKPPTTKRVWDSRLKKYVQRTEAQILKDPDRYGMTEATAREMRKAGATTITLEKFGLQKQATAANVRTQLRTNKSDKDFYDSAGRIFNTTNVGNEIAFWDSTAGLFGRGQIKIVKLNKKMIAEGATPAGIQEYADNNGITVQEALDDLKKALKVR